VVREVGKFVRLGTTSCLERWKDCEGGRIGTIISRIRNVLLHLRVHCVNYYSGEYRTERLLPSTRCSPCCSSSENCRQKPFRDNSNAAMISCVSDDENWEVVAVGKFGR
jgi:hypothetical protein